MDIDFTKEFTYSDVENGVILGICYGADDYNYYDLSGNKISNYNGFKIIKKGGGLYRRVRRSIKNDKILKDNPFSTLRI